MESRPSKSPDTVSRRRLIAAVKQGVRELSQQLSLLNHHVSAHLDLNDVDLDCLDLIARQGPLTPSSLARQVGLHPATVTGILDRLERGGWIVREREALDRRSVLVRLLPARNAEVLRLYAGMNASMDDICGSYGETELAVLADFLRRAANAGRGATDDLAAE